MNPAVTLVPNFSMPSGCCPRCGSTFADFAAGSKCLRCALELATEDPGLGEGELDSLFPELRIEGKIAHGGFGAVYRAEHRRLQRSVALKLLDPRLTHSREVVSRFEQEIAAVGQLDHPGIVRAYDAGEREGRWFIVMEFVDGEDLATLSRRRGPLPPHEACRLVQQAALALAYAHGRGLVHRDVKPSNMMVATTAEGTRVVALSPVKVLDFGLSEFENATDGGGGMRGFCGTPDYAAPEVIETPGEVDARADVFGLGATLFRLLTGRPPRGEGGEGGDESLIARIQRMATTDPPKLATLIPDLPRGLAEICDRMLAHDRNHRPATATEVAELLAPFAESKPPWWKSRGRWLTAATAAICAAAALLWWSRNPVPEAGGVSAPSPAISALPASVAPPPTAPSTAIFKSLAPDTEILVVTGAQPGQGLDLSAPALHAINLGTINGLGKIGELNFTSVGGPVVHIENYMRSGWVSAPDFGSAPNDRALGQLFYGIGRGNAKGPLGVTLGGLTPGRRYHLQLLFSEGVQELERKSTNRVFDVKINGALLVDEFSVTNAQGGFPLTTRCSAISHHFTARESDVRIRLDGSSVTTPGVETQPVLSGIILQAVTRVPDGGQISIEQPEGSRLSPHRLFAWGWNRFAQTTFPENLPPIRAITAGVHHTVILKEDGTVLAVGWNEFGQSTVPPGLSGVKAISGGVFHSLALKEDGTVVAWGRNSDGQGVVPEGLEDVVAISAGGFHNAALKKDGTVVVWGRKVEGQRQIPKGLSGIKSVVAGGDHVIALKEDGTVAVWGSSGRGENANPPWATGLKAISSGGYFNIALREDGRVVGWGDNNANQVSIPSGLTDVQAIWTGRGGEYAIALQSDGRLTAWGQNNRGQCDIPGWLRGVESIAAGAAHVVALLRHRVDFGPGTPGITAPPKSFTIRNAGAGPLQVSSVSAVGGNAPDFPVAPLSLPTTVAAGGTLTFTVTFTPGSQGLRSTTLQVQSDDPFQGSFDIELTGTGVAPN